MSPYLKGGGVIEAGQQPNKKRKIMPAKRRGKKTKKDQGDGGLPRKKVEKGENPDNMFSFL